MGCCWDFNSNNKTDNSNDNDNSSNDNDDDDDEYYTSNSDSDVDLAGLVCCRVKELIKYSSEELEGKSLYDYHHALDSHIVEKAYKDCKSLCPLSCCCCYLLVA